MEPNKKTKAMPYYRYSTSKLKKWGKTQIPGKQMEHQISHSQPVFYPGQVRTEILQISTGPSKALNLTQQPKDAEKATA